MVKVRDCHIQNPNIVADGSVDQDVEERHHQHQPSSRLIHLFSECQRSQLETFSPVSVDSHELIESTRVSEPGDTPENEYLG